MDIQMPVMDGIQATIEIRRIEKLNAASGYPLPSPSTENGMLTPSSASGSATSLSEFRSIDSPYRSSVIIVALTASSLQSDRVAALAAGCNDFLTKPVSLLWLNNKIIEWGSIKALQMWADIRPDAVETMQSGQAAQATRVAARLHVPPSAKVPARWSSMLDDNAAALALASSGGPLRTPAVAMIPPSPTASYFKIPEHQQQSAEGGSWLGNPLNEQPSPVDGASAASSKPGSGDSEDGERLFVFSRIMVGVLMAPYADGAPRRIVGGIRQHIDSIDAVTPKTEAAQHAARRRQSSGDSTSRSITPIQGRPRAPSAQARLAEPLNYKPLIPAADARPVNGDGAHSDAPPAEGEHKPTPAPPPPANGGHAVPAP